jgi:hypothetical protein
MQLILSEFCFVFLKAGVYNSSVLINVTSVDSYTGTKNETVDTLEITFRKEWILRLAYELKKSAYVLGEISLQYTTDEDTFPHVSQPGQKRTAAISGLNEFSANKGNSYKCYSQTDITVNGVDLIFKNYQAEPFMEKTEEFDTGKRDNSFIVFFFKFSF